MLEPFIAQFNHFSRRQWCDFRWDKKWVLTCWDKRKLRWVPWRCTGTLPTGWCKTSAPLHPLDPPHSKKVVVDETKFKKWFWTNIVEIRNKSYREEFDLIAFEKLFQPFVEFQPNELGAAVRWAMLVLGRLDLTPWPGLRRRPTVGLAHSASMALVDTGAIVVDMSVQFHVPRHLEQTYIPSLK